jgi:hypothetical protein
MVRNKMMATTTKTTKQQPNWYQHIVYYRCYAGYLGLLLKNKRLLLDILRGFAFQETLLTVFLMLQTQPYSPTYARLGEIPRQARYRRLLQLKLESLR